MARNEQLSCTLFIFDKLLNSRYGVEIPELANELNVHPKTIRRTLNTLESAFPITVDEHEGKKRFKLIQGFKQEFDVPFLPTELMSLYFFKDFLLPLQGTGFEEQFLMIIKKIENGIPESAKRFCDQLENSFRTRVTQLPSHKDTKFIMKQVNDAVCELKALKITYFSYSSKRTAVRKIHPYCLYYFDGTIYIVAKDFLSHEIRIFNVERVRKAEVLKERFTKPKDFVAEDYFNDAFGIFKGKDMTTVVIEFSKSVAPFILEKKWHHSQQIKHLPQGKVELRMTLSSLAEVKSWVLSFGKHAKVTAPAELVKEIKEDVRKMRDLYE